MSDERARSFIERYVIARAAHFELGNEQHDAWAAAQMGRNIYRNIAEVARTAEPQDLAANQVGGAGQRAPWSRGVTGPAQHSVLPSPFDSAAWTGKQSKLP